MRYEIAWRKVKSIIKMQDTLLQNQSKGFLMGYGHGHIGLTNHL